MLEPIEPMTYWTADSIKAYLRWLRSKKRGYDMEQKYITNILSVN